MHICVYGAASASIDPAYMAAGEELGRCMAANGHTLVFGGGGNGLMDAVARGIQEGGGTSTAVVPSFFRVDGILSPYCTETIYTDTMRERKQKMEDLSDAFIMTPGGIGTFDEFFEILTLRSLGRHKKPIAVLNTNGYYKPLAELLENTVRESFMSRENAGLARFFDKPEPLLAYLESC